MHETRPDTDWCLFLDRDGVLNRQVVGDYVRSWAQFEWLPGALSALVRLSDWAPHVVVVTNQQGVGKGLMDESDLEDIHVRMRQQVVGAGGRLDAVLACPHRERDRCRCRKPRAGLGTAWLQDRPWIDPEKCVVVGDSWRDIAMGRVLTSGRGRCVWIGPRDAEPPVPTPDAGFESLSAFVDSLDIYDTVRETA
jgi:D-glycero-D-manno-heptose 1,7-bisphosphate phosphatase